MGRKPTLQPLALTDNDNNNNSNKNRNKNKNKNKNKNNSNSDIPTLGAETLSSAVASSTDARSPRSLRATSLATSALLANCPRNQPPSTVRSVSEEPTSASTSTSTWGREQHQQQPARNDPAAASPSHNPSPASASTSTPAPSLGSRSLATEAPRPTKGSFFQFNKGSKSVGQFPTIQTHNFLESRSQLHSRGSDGAVDVSRNKDFGYTDDAPHKPFPSLSDISIPNSATDTDGIPSPSYVRKNKSKSFGLLSRSKSSHSDIESPKASPMVLPSTPSSLTLTDSSTPCRTTPTGQDRPHRDIMSSVSHTLSEDGLACQDAQSGRENHRDRDREREGHGQRDHHKDSHHKEKDHKSHHPILLRDTGASILFNGIKNSSTRAADLLSKGLFGKTSRSGSTTQREPVVDDEHYVLKVLNLALVEQTRLTRISKRLEDSRDKTEFWMPAFPWRAIDYLNYRGCEVEGLYRVPGSGPQVKKWQRKFDEQYDVNLFEETSLYDINIVGSMLKAWLRELPDELLPKEAQERIARECAGAETVPQMLVDELSNLPPFNYYLLFAITCHLSLLLAHSDKNKMDFRNLCICFQPCMKIDAFCFKFLVCDWRDCWSGCRNEARYIEEEYLLFDQPPPQGLSDVQPPQQPTTIIKEERPPSPPILDLPPGHGSGSGSGRLNRHQLLLTKSNESMASKSSTISTDITAESENEIEADTGSVGGLAPIPNQSVPRDLRPLSPIQPLSPLGF